MRARHAVLMAAATFSAAVCAGVWSVRAWMESAPGGMLVFAIALAGFALGIEMLRDALKNARLAANERRWEREREPVIRL